MEENGRGEEKVKRKEGERWREGCGGGPPKNVGVAPPMPVTYVIFACFFKPKPYM